MFSMAGALHTHPASTVLWGKVHQVLSNRPNFLGPPHTDLRPSSTCPTAQPAGRIQTYPLPGCDVLGIISTNASTNAQGGVEMYHLLQEGVWGVWKRVLSPSGGTPESGQTQACSPSSARSYSLFKI